MPNIPEQVAQGDLPGRHDHVFLLSPVVLQHRGWLGLVHQPPAQHRPLPYMHRGRVSRQLGADKPGLSGLVPLLRVSVRRDRGAPILPRAQGARLRAGHLGRVAIHHHRRHCALLPGHAGGGAAH